MSARFAALQHRDFRLLWSSRIPSLVGNQMQNIAINWHVYDLLRDSEAAFTFLGREFIFNSEKLQALGLGSMGLARVVPLLLFALLAGIVADSYSRRKVMLATQILATGAAIVLTWLTLSGQATVPLLYGFAAITAVLSTFEMPASQSLIPNLVPRENLANAVSLNSILLYIGTIAGPGIAAFLISKIDIGFVYGINALTFFSVIFALLAMKYREEKRESNFSWAALKEGVVYTYENKLVWSTMWIDFWATFFGSARSMLPIISERILGMGVEGYGLLATAQPVGAVLTGLLISLFPTIRRQGRTLLIAVGVYGLATALFGLSNMFGLSYVLFALTGSADTISSIIRGTIRQMTTPDELRGRMTSVNMMFFAGGPQLGEVEAGIVAASFGAPFAIVTGGLATIVMTGYMAWKFPKLRAYDQ